MMWLEDWLIYGAGTALVVGLFGGLFYWAHTLDKHSDRVRAEACAQANHVARTSADSIEVVKICHGLDERSTAYVPIVIPVITPR
jgi:hypothetical protein